MKKLAFLAATAVALLSVSAQATTYTGSHSVGNGSVGVSITTDGTIGLLTGANITDWTILLTQGATNFTLKGPLSGANSQLLHQGNALSATATQLLFDYGASGFDLFQAPGIGSSQTFWCPQASNGCFDFLGAGEGLLAGTSYSDYTRSDRSGVEVLGVAGGVPEPAAWALIIGGFALTGATLRRRVPVAA